ncbi:MAG TPA: Ig-like domain-containing protein [Gemmatimonadaceae bacterium]|nr:Ig-like domain-containing protein [Gemmatimonadaceae bacterium]
MALVAIACGGGTPPESSPVISVQVTPSAVTLKPGDNKQLTAKVLGPAGIKQTVIWKSLNTDVATVSGTGLVHAVAEGGTTIRVEWTESSDEFAVADIQVNASPISEGGLRAGVRKRSNQ